jgi:hypothetical protein
MQARKTLHKRNLFFLPQLRYLGDGSQLERARNLRGREGSDPKWYREMQAFLCTSGRELRPEFQAGPTVNRRATIERVPQVALQRPTAPPDHQSGEVLQWRTDGSLDAGRSRQRCHLL